MNANEIRVRYGAAPAPKIPPYYIKISPAGTTPPGMYIYPTPIKGDKEQKMGIAVKRFYFLKNKDDLSYCMSEDGKGEIVVNGLLMQLQRNGYTQAQVLETMLP